MELKPVNREPNLIVYSKQTYTALEKDMIYHLINQLPDWKTGAEWPENRLFTVEFHKDALIEKKHTRIKQALKNLNEKRIIRVDDNKKEASFSSIFPDCSIKNGVITIQLLGRYVPVFTDLKAGYSVYNIVEILSLSGINPKRLFELLSGYVNRREPVFKVDVNTLKQYLGVEDRYKASNTNFKNKVIEPALLQINEKTGLEVDFEIKRENGTTYVIFEIDRKNKLETEQPAAQIDVPDGYNETQRLAETRARLIGFSEKQIKQIMSVERYEFFNSWYFQNQPEIKGAWSARMAMGNYYNLIKK